MHKRFGLVAIATLLLVLISPGSSVKVAAATGRCDLMLQSGITYSISRGTAFRQDFLIDANSCTFTATQVRELSGAELKLALDNESNSEGSTTQVKAHFKKMKAPGDPIVFSRHSTWDCCGIETTYTDHQQTYTYDGTNSSVNAILTTAFARTGTGCFTTAGPSQWFNTGNPASSVSTAGSTSFDNTTFPCGCQPCNHTLNAEVRSYADGHWTPKRFVDWQSLQWIHSH